MNPELELLQPYPFEKLRKLFEGITPAKDCTPINMGIGEPQHPTPEIVLNAIRENLHLLGKYPPTGGTPGLRQAISSWISERHDAEVDPDTQVLPVSGTREALFGFAQAVLDRAKRPIVLLPNPFYQIYEGAALLAGAEPFYVPTPQEAGFLPDWDAVPDEVWPRVQLVYVCSPGNPTGACLELEHWQQIFDLSDRHGFIVASDECYSEIYMRQRPIGALEAAQGLGRSFQRIVAFNSLSKRSSAPGLRSGFVAGDEAILEKYLLYRTYHGAAPSLMVQAASEAAWSDEDHVVDNRAWYRAKFQYAAQHWPAHAEEVPEGSFFFWSQVGDDERFARELFATTGITVLPGSYLAREVGGVNPGAGYVRIALVPEFEVCCEAIDRISEFESSYARS